MAAEPIARPRKLQHPFFVLFLVLLVPSAAALVPLIGIERAVLLAFDFAAAIFVGASFLKMRRASPDRLRATAARNDSGRPFLLLVAAVALLVVLMVVGLELERPGSSDGPRVVLVAATLTIAWLFGNMVYAFHYAHMFYDPGPGGGDHAGLVFPRTEQPDFQDFCYFACVLGMTFQVSDVQIVSSRIRRTAMAHGLVAFFFNIGVVALTVNVVASAI